MPSDDRLQAARDALQSQGAGFRAAVGSAYAQVRAYLAAHGARSDERARETALELGRFAAGRIDAGRLAAVLGTTRVLDEHEESAVGRCADVMGEVLAGGEGLFVCQVSAGGDLRATVEDALAMVGRAFGAALVFQAVKAGTYRAEQHQIALRAFPFRRWTRGERLLAPPLVVSLAGSDLDAPSLAGYLDGRQKIVLVVQGASAPAPLARLITPRLFVMQAEAPSELARLAATEGPGIAALLPASAVRFVHDPAARRLEVTLAAAQPRTSLGGWSPWQQEEELALLRKHMAAEVAAAEAEAAKIAAETAQVADAIAAVPSPRERMGNGGVVGSGPVEVDQLATWMLAQAGFPGGAA